MWNSDGSFQSLWCRFLGTKFGALKRLSLFLRQLGTPLEKRARNEQWG